MAEQQMNKDDCLLTAHHQNDQAETVLQNLIRGSGPRGLSAIQSSRKFGNGRLLRPLLVFSKDQIDQYASDHKLPFIVDPANFDLKHDRNYLRHVIFPEIEKRWPTAVRQFTYSASLLSEAQSIFDDIARLDAEHCASKGTGYLCFGYQLNLNQFRHLGDIRQRNLIRFWSRSHGFREPNRKLLSHLLNSIISNRAGYFELHGLEGYRICVYDDNLYLAPLRELGSEITSIKWNANRPLILGKVKIEVVDESSGESTSTTVERSFENLTVKLRSGGERIVLPGRSHSTSLKKLLQQLRIPPWERSLLPLIFLEDDLVAVAPCIYSKYWQNQFTSKRVSVVIQQ